MTPAETLRAAADVIDQTRAETRPEHVGRYRVDPTFWNVLDGNECCVIASTSHAADAAWIALLDPGIGESLVDLLRDLAVFWDEASSDWIMPAEALVLARHILDKAGDA